MKNSVKAALLSAFVYPGVGHFFLKKYVMGSVFVCGFSVPLFFIIRKIMATAEQLVEQIKNGEIGLDIAAMSQALSSSVTDANAQDLNFIKYVLVIVWFIATIDSYRIGHIKA